MMIAELGHVALVLALAAALYQRISTRRVAATGSSRNSRPETWTVIVNWRRTSAPAVRFSTCLGLRRATCYFAAAFFGAVFFAATFFAAVFFAATFFAAAFFGEVFFAATFFGAAFLGAAFFPFTAALTATSPLLKKFARSPRGGARPSGTLAL
jgi:hypothetical protein